MAVTSGDFYLQNNVKCANPTSPTLQVSTLLSGSTALLADALHMLSDFASYAISLAILWVTTSRAAGPALHTCEATDADATVAAPDPCTACDDAAGNDKKKSGRALTYGYGRVEVLGALGIILIVWVATGALVVEAVKRLADPPDVDGRTVALTAIGGLGVNAAGLYKLIAVDP
jgi:zinc transporter 2